MTEEQQMEVRKNLGLYYEDTVTEVKDERYHGQPESPTLTGYAKVADDTPAKEDIVCAMFMGDECAFTTTDTEDGYFVNINEISISISPEAIRVVLNDSQGNEPGVYTVMSGDQYGIKYNAQVPAYNNQIPPQYIKDMYYEETTTEEKTAECQEHEYDSHRPPFIKISDDTPTKDDIVALLVYNYDNGEYVESEFTIREGEGVISIENESLNTRFRVQSDGIYYESNAISQHNDRLVYRAQVNTVSKVPEKFLPIAWDQLVTEGTKIAELTIGNEKTNVFAPNGGGVEFATITGLPTESMTYSQINAIGITHQMINSVVDGDVVGLMYVPVSGEKRPLCILSAGKGDEYNMGYAYIRFTGGDSIYYVSIGPATEPAAIVSVTRLVTDAPGPVEITGLPTASMTTFADIAAIGLSLADVSDAARGKKTGIHLYMSDNDYFVPITLASKISANFTLTFNFGANSYSCSFDGISETVNVTITPLS
jgi:hypothetical protein